MALADTPFRFGAYASELGDPRHVLEAARRAEDLGYDSFHVTDHLVGQLSPGPLLGAAAVRTSTIRIGCAVYCNGFRPLAVLANEVATLDLLSGGRMECGIGAGWNAVEHRQAGLAFEDGGVRLARLLEAVDALRALLGGAPVTVRGDHYRLEGFASGLRPIQQPHPPIMIGGAGPLLLEQAARRAEVVSIAARSAPDGSPIAGDVTARGVARKAASVRAAAAGRALPPRLHLLAWSAAVGPRAGRPGTNPYVLDGDADGVGEALLEQRDRTGIAFVSVPLAHVEAFAPVVAALTSA